MVRPTAFRFNEQTAANNTFQRIDAQNNAAGALNEWNAFADSLEREGVCVFRFDSPPDTPDAVFPNNWLSLHEDGTMVLYPMFAPNRRIERQTEITETLAQITQRTRIIDYTQAELSGKFLEGTGSMVLDRKNMICYAALSERTNLELAEKFCADLDYNAVLFHTDDGTGAPIYHTNVIMCLGEDFSVICLDAIKYENERFSLRNSIEESGKEIITISLEQMKSFAGNCLQLRGSDKQRILVMSERGYASLNYIQRERLSAHNDKILRPRLDIIENCGGGSARCMLGEVF
ncbi:MAG: amidinotransferase [Bacteroidetes bacterium]|nr:amidinotransferase [Bacteroidota bacterium]